MNLSFNLSGRLVLAGYIITLTLIGSFFYRKKSSSADYFLGGRHMSWMLVGISLVAADMSAISYMGMPAWTFRHNWELFLSLCGYLTAAPVVMYLFLPFYMRFKFTTGYQYLERRYDLKTRLLGSALFLLTRGSHVAIVIYAPSIALSTILGLPLHGCILATGIFTTIYTTLGGIKAVIWTDTLQFTVLLTGIITVYWFTLSGIPGGLHGVLHVSQAAHRFQVFNFTTNPDHMTSFWAMILGGLVLFMATLGTDQAYLQRYFATNSLREGRRAILTDALVALPVSFMLYAVGTMLFAYYHFHPGLLHGLKTIDAILPFFVVQQVGGMISGLIIASIFAASMAVMSAGINSLTTVTSVDFYQRLFRPSATDRHMVVVGRVGTVIWGGAATLGALFANRLGPLVNSFNLINSILGGPILGIFLMGMLVKRANGTGIVVGAFSGLVVVFLFAFQTHISFFYYGPIGLATTCGVGYLISLLFKPVEKNLAGLVVGTLGSEL